MTGNKSKHLLHKLWVEWETDEKRLLQGCLFFYMFGSWMNRVQHMGQRHGGLVPRERASLMGRCPQRGPSQAPGLQEGGNHQVLTGGVRLG